LIEVRLAAICDKDGIAELKVFGSRPAARKAARGLAPWMIVPPTALTERAVFLGPFGPTRPV